MTEIDVLTMTNRQLARELERALACCAAVERTIGIRGHSLARWHKIARFADEAETALIELIGRQKFQERGPQ